MGISEDLSPFKKRKRRKMKRFYDAYIRPQKGFVNFDAENKNLLQYFDKLDLLKSGAYIKMEPETETMEDGTTFCNGMKIEFESGVINVSNDMALWFLDYNNTLCDVLMFDLNNLDMIINITGIRIKVEKIIEKGECVLIKISGMTKFGTEGLDNKIRIEYVELPFGIIEGKVLDLNGFPLNVGFVLIGDGTINDLLNIDGSCNIMCIEGKYNITAYMTNHTFDEHEVDIVKNERTILDIREV